VKNKMVERETLYKKAKRLEYVGLILVGIGLFIIAFLGIAATTPILFMTYQGAQVLGIFAFFNIILGVFCFELADRCWEKRVCL
jgi:hypothetical protein